jgi:hypothetical protein
MTAEAPVNHFTDAVMAAATLNLGIQIAGALATALFTAWAVWVTLPHVDRSKEEHAARRKLAQLASHYRGLISRASPHGGLEEEVANEIVARMRNTLWSVEFATEAVAASSSLPEREQEMVNTLCMELVGNTPFMKAMHDVQHDRQSSKNPQLQQYYGLLNNIYNPATEMIDHDLKDQAISVLRRIGSVSKWSARRYFMKEAWKRFWGPKPLG